MRREINKGDIEFQMFNDMWAFRKEWHDGENGDDYWERMIEAGRKVISKYEGTEVHGFITMLINDCIADAETRWKNKKKK